MNLTLAGQHRHRVLLAGPVCAEVLARLGVFFEVEQVDNSDVLDRAVLAARLAGKSALMATRTARIDSGLLANLLHLKVVCKVGLLHADIDLEACTRAGVMATNTPDLGVDVNAQRRMSLAAAENLIAAFGFGRAAGHPKNLLNTELRCMLGCCG
jgi:glyoxylate/hydroxypyruvate/2-ketogluconate reductase